jgi:hypothetical protein
MSPLPGLYRVKEAKEKTGPGFDAPGNAKKGRI